MKLQYAPLQQFWQQRSQSERQTLKIGAGIIGLLLLYLCIWSPILTMNDQLRSTVLSTEKELAWMQAADANLQQFRGTPSPTNTKLSPLQAMDYLQKAVNTAGLAHQLTQLKQVTNDSITVQFQAVSFTALINLLHSFLKIHPLLITQFSAYKTPTVDIVNADIVLKSA